jgi:hypothetical protein
MLEACGISETLSTIIPLEDPVTLGGNATAFALLLLNVEKNAAAGGHVPPGLMAGLVAFVRLIAMMQPLPPLVKSLLLRQLLVMGIGATFAAPFPMLKNIQSPDPGERLVLLNSVTGEHARVGLFAVEFIGSGVPTLFKTPAEVKLSW